MFLHGHLTPSTSVMKRVAVALKMQISVMAVQTKYFLLIYLNPMTLLLNYVLALQYV